MQKRDYVHAFAATATFLLIVIFITPISGCLKPAGKNEGTSRCVGGGWPVGLGNDIIPLGSPYQRGQEGILDYWIQQGDHHHGLMTTAHLSPGSPEQPY